MKGYRVGTKGYYLAITVNLEVEVLAGDVIVVVHIVILQTICFLVPSTTFGFIAFGRREGFRWIADMNGGIMLVSYF